MAWYAFHGSGSVYNLNGITDAELAATGAHGYATKEEAIAHPNAPESGMQSAILAGVQISASIPVTGSMIGVQSGTTKAVTPVSIIEFLGRLEMHATWQRVVEVVVGGVLLIIAAKSMLPSGVTQPVTKVAKKAAWFA